MTKFFLQQLNKGLYQDNIACAYIYYGDKNHPQDQNGKPIGVFYQDPFVLEKHLRNLIVPILNEGLKKSNYIATDVGFENQAPHPFIIIMRRDKNIITQTDLDHIETLIEKISKPVQLMNSSTLFAQNKKRHTPPEQQEHLAKRTRHI